MVAAFGSARRRAPGRAPARARILTAAWVLPLPRRARTGRPFAVPRRAARPWFGLLRPSTLGVGDGSEPSGCDSTVSDACRKRRQAPFRIRGCDKRLSTSAFRQEDSEVGIEQCYRDTNRLGNIGAGGKRRAADGPARPAARKRADCGPGPAEATGGHEPALAQGRLGPLPGRGCGPRPAAAGPTGIRQLVSRFKVID